MGFLNGRVTFTRYRVSGSSPLPFADDLLALAVQHAAGRHGSADPTDGVSTGWSGGDHVLDLTIDLAKNVVNDALQFAVRIDTDKIPGSLLKAYTQIETEARAKLNPSGHPTKAQRQEAKEAARLRARPRPTTAGSAGSTITPSSGMARAACCTRAPPARPSWSGWGRSSGKHSTATSSRSPPVAWPPAWPGRTPTTGTRKSWPRESSASSAASSPGCPRSPGPRTPPTCSTTSVTSSWSGSGTRC